MGDPTHIELFGLPGSGKTTVAEQLSTRYAGSIYTPRQSYTLGLRRPVLPDRFASVYDWIVTTFIDCVLYFKITNGGVLDEKTNYRECATNLIADYTTDTQRSTTVTKWITQLERRYSVTMSNSDCGSIVLFDEGFLQRGNAIFCPPTVSKDISYEDVTKYLQTIPTPDLIVLLNISVSVSETRINRRDDGPPRSFSAHDRSELLERLDRMKLFTEYVHSVSHELSIPIICIENEGPIQDAIAKLDEHIQTIL